MRPAPTCRLSPATPGTAALSAMILLLGFMIALSALIGRFSGAEGAAVSMMTCSGWQGWDGAEHHGRGRGATARDIANWCQAVGARQGKLKVKLDTEKVAAKCLALEQVDDWEQKARCMCR